MPIENDSAGRSRCRCEACVGRLTSDRAGETCKAWLFAVRSISSIDALPQDIG